MLLPSRSLVLACLAAGVGRGLSAQPILPLRQSSLDWSARDPGFKVELDSTFDARGLGGGATAPRWDLEGRWVYFQFALDPKPVVAGPIDDPWWRVSRDGRRVEPVARKDALLIPATVAYTKDGARAAYFHRNELRYWKRGVLPRLLLSRADNITPRWSPDEREIRFLSGGDLWAVEPESGALRQLTRSFVQPAADECNRTVAPQAAGGSVRLRQAAAGRPR